MSRYVDKPKIRSSDDRKLMKEIKKEIESRYRTEDLSKEEKQQLCNIAYNLTKDMNKKGYTPPKRFACGPGIPAIVGGVLVVSDVVVGFSAAAWRIAKAVDWAISVNQGVNAIAEYAKNVGVGSNSNDSDSINNPSKTTTLINPEKPDTLQKKKINEESGSKKTETNENKSTGTGGGGSNKEPNDEKESGLKKKVEVNGEYKSKIDFTDDIQSNNKPTTNTTFNSKDGSNVPSNVNSGEALKEKYKDLISAQKNAVKVEKLPDGRIRYYKESKPSKIPGNTKESCRVTEYNPQTGDVKSWQNNIGHDGKTIRVHVQRINGKEAIGQHYPQTGSEVSGVKQYPNYKDLKIQELIKKIDK